MWGRGLAGTYGPKAAEQPQMLGQLCFIFLYTESDIVLSDCNPVLLESVRASKGRNTFLLET